MQYHLEPGCQLSCFNFLTDSVQLYTVHFPGWIARYIKSLQFLRLQESLYALTSAIAELIPVTCNSNISFRKNDKKIQRENVQ